MQSTFLSGRCWQWGGLVSSGEESSEGTSAGQLQWHAQPLLLPLRQADQVRSLVRPTGTSGAPGGAQRVEETGASPGAAFRKRSHSTPAAGPLGRAYLGEPPQYDLGKAGTLQRPGSRRGPSEKLPQSTSNQEGSPQGHDHHELASRVH